MVYLTLEIFKYIFNNMKYKDRRYGSHSHMRRSAVSAGRPGGMITEITWKVGNLEVICLHGGLRLCRLISDE